MITAEVDLHHAQRNTAAAEIAEIAENDENSDDDSAASLENESDETELS